MPTNMKSKKSSLLGSIGIGILFIFGFFLSLQLAIFSIAFHYLEIWDGAPHLIISEEKQKWDSGLRADRKVYLTELPALATAIFVADADPKFWQRRKSNFFVMYGQTWSALIQGEPLPILSMSRINYYVARDLVREEVTKRRAKNIERHFINFVATYRVTTRMSKSEVLHLYLNSIYFGHEKHGIADAVRFYFGIHDDELDRVSAAQWATLAAISRSPSSYQAPQYRHKLKARRDKIIVKSRRLGNLSNEVAEAAMAEPLGELAASKID